MNKTILEIQNVSRCLTHEKIISKENKLIYASIKICITNSQLIILMDAMSETALDFVFTYCMFKVTRNGRRF